MTHDVDLDLLALVANTMRVSQMQRARRTTDYWERDDALGLVRAASRVHDYLARKKKRQMALKSLCHDLPPRMLRDLIGHMADGLGWAEYDAMMNAEGSSLQDYFDQNDIDGDEWLAQLNKKLQPLDGLCDRLDEILEQRPDV